MALLSRSLPTSAFGRDRARFLLPADIGPIKGRWGLWQGRPQADSRRPTLDHFENAAQNPSKTQCRFPRKCSSIFLEKTVWSGKDGGVSMCEYGTKKPAAYRPRIIDERLRKALDTFGAVEVRGPKWCGKSWTAFAFGESAVHLDDPNVKMLVEADTSLALQGSRPHVVDEWLRFPRYGTPRAAPSTRRAASEGCSFSPGRPCRRRTPSPTAGPAGSPGST